MLTVIISIFCIAFGLYSIYARIYKKEQFSKIEAMQKLYGEKLGTYIHVFFYTVMPLLLGIALLVMYIGFGVEVF